MADDKIIIEWQKKFNALIDVDLGFTDLEKLALWRGYRMAMEKNSEARELAGWMVVDKNGVAVRTHIEENLFLILWYNK